MMNFTPWGNAAENVSKGENQLFSLKSNSSNKQISMLHFFAYLIEIFVTILVLLLNATEITDGRVRKFVVISSSVSLVISPLVLVKQLQAFIESFLLYFFLSQALFYWDILHRWTCLNEQLDYGINMCFQLLHCSQNSPKGSVL